MISGPQQMSGHPIVILHHSRGERRITFILGPPIHETQAVRVNTVTHCGCAASHALALRLEALAALGELLKQTPKATGGDAQRTRFHKGTESPPTLSEF